MSTENKWKTPSESTENTDLFNELMEKDVLEKSTSSQWTTQRKMGLAMGSVGLMLVLAGVSPMFLDSENSNSIKGSLTENAPETAPDPLLALFGSESATPMPTPISTPEANTVEVVIPVATPVATPLSTPNTLAQNTDDTINVESDNSQVIPVTTSIDHEVDQIISDESTLARGETITNTNTGATDTLGAEFMDSQPGNTTMVNVSENTNNETFHGAASLQNTAVATSNASNLSDSGPADAALIVFLLSLFFVGWFRYFRKG